MSYEWLSQENERLREEVADLRKRLREREEIHELKKALRDLRESQEAMTISADIVRRAFAMGRPLEAVQPPEKAPK